LYALVQGQKNNKQILSEKERKKEKCSGNYTETADKMLN